jgi:hypothetical protein
MYFLPDLLPQNSIWFETATMFPSKYAITVQLVPVGLLRETRHLLKHGR